MRTYIRTKHRFFDQLVTFMGSYIAIGLGVTAQHRGWAPQFTPRQNIIIRGRPKVSNMEFVFYPYSLMQFLVSKRWPSQLKFHERPLKTTPNKLFIVPIKVRGTGRLHAYLIMSAFIHYFESVRHIVESKYTEDCQNWPSVWNFGRVVRNAFAHGGCIKIENPNALSVVWSNLTYTPQQNGQQIIYQDITPVEMVLLMEDMDSTL